MKHLIKQFVLSGLFWAPYLCAQPLEEGGPIDNCLGSSQTRALLERLLVAHPSRNYEGTVLFERHKERHFLSVGWPRAGHQGELQRLNVGGEKSKEFWPGPTSKFAKVCDLARAYTVISSEGRVIAGRPTHRLTFKPRDSLRWGHIFEIDKETGLALAAQIFGPNQSVLERFEFAEITISAESAAETLEQSLFSDNREVIPGFFEVKEGAKAGIFSVSDGFATASVFVEPLPLGVPLGEGAVMEGATLVYSRGVGFANKSALISVMGEVPLVTGRLLAETFRQALGDS